MTAFQNFSRALDVLSEVRDDITFAMTDVGLIIELIAVVFTEDSMADLNSGAIVSFAPMLLTWFIWRITAFDADVFKAVAAAAVSKVAKAALYALDARTVVYGFAVAVIGVASDSSVGALAFADVNMWAATIAVLDCMPIVALTKATLLFSV